MIAERSRRGGRWRWTVLAAVTAGAVVAAVISVGAEGSGTPSVATDTVATVPIASLQGKSHLLLRSTALNHDFGRVALVAADDPGGPRAITAMTCDRVDYAGGRGICLTRRSAALLPITQAIIFNSQYQTTSTVTLAGFPSRARVAPDGQWGAVTNFVNGDTYATMGFSTRTDIIDLRTGTVAFDLEKLAVTRDGQRFDNVNDNFWGVTWSADSTHFYATLGSGSATYLIEGDVATRQAIILTTGVECPSLSPDGTRIAYKKRVPGPTVTWHLNVLDLATLRSVPVAETRDVDDQVEWLNNTTIMYGLPTQVGATAAPSANIAGVPAQSTGSSIATDTWTVPANGSGHPTLLIHGAWSAQLVQP